MSSTASFCLWLTQHSGSQLFGQGPLTPAGNVRDVHAGVALAHNIHLVVLQRKGVDKVLPEAHELAGDVFLVLRGRSALGEAGAHGLVDVDDIGQSVPAPGVLDRRVRSILPQEGAVLLEKTLEG